LRERPREQHGAAHVPAGENGVAAPSVPRPRQPHRRPPRPRWPAGGCRGGGVGCGGHCGPPPPGGPDAILLRGGQCGIMMFAARACQWRAAVTLSGACSTAAVGADDPGDHGPGPSSPAGYATSCLLGCATASAPRIRRRRCPRSRSAARSVLAAALRRRRRWRGRSQAAAAAGWAERGRSHSFINSRGYVHEKPNRCPHQIVLIMRGLFKIGRKKAKNLPLSTSKASVCPPRFSVLLITSFVFMPRFLTCICPGQSFIPGNVRPRRQRQKRGLGKPARPQ
jgi:hypothetical protein